jgi:hypothetical protein
MTCSNTDCVKTEPWLIAGSLILCIASPLFYRWAQDTSFRKNATYEAYRTLRRFAELFGKAHSIDLENPSPLIEALEFAHDSHHEFVRTDLAKSESQFCSCHVAGEIRALRSVLAGEVVMTA